MNNVSKKIVLYLILIVLCGVSITACIYWQGNQEPKSSIVSDELNKVMRFLDRTGIITYGVALTKDGCYNTTVDVSDIYQAMNIK